MALKPEDFENVERDIDDTGKAINTKGIITPRYGDPFKSVPMVVEEIENKGGLISAPTLAALNAIMPTYNHQVAMDESTGNLYRWNPAASPTPKWEPTNRNMFNDAISISNTYTNTRVGEFINSPPLDIFTITNKITGSYIGKTGVQNASASWSCSGFLKVNVRDVLIFNASATNAVAFIAAYDVNKVFLRELISTPSASVTVLNGQKEIEADVKFIRVSFYTANSTAYSFQIKPFQFETDMLNKRETSDMVFDELTAKPNLFDVTKARNGYSLVNNVETGNTNWIYSDFIPVIPSEAYTSNKSGFKSGSSQTGIHYYDVNKVFLAYADPQLADIPFTVPLNASYMRLNFVKTINPEIGVDDIVVNHGLTAKKNGKFEEKVKEVLENSSNVLHRYNGFIYIPMGDSITDSTTTPTTYPPEVAKHFGMTLIDCAISGSRTRSSFAKSTATLANLSSANIFTIAHGTNDFQLETHLGAITDAPTPKATLDDPAYRSDENLIDGTFYADYKGVIEYIYSINSNARIFLFTPIRRTQGAKYTGTDTNRLGLKLIDYVNAIKEIASYYSLPLLDNYNTSGFNQKTMPIWLGDGLHPTAWAQKNVMAQKAIGFIDSN